MMRSAAANGYQVDLIFIALENADLNVERVAERVARGGHDIPEATIRRRYDTAMARLPDAIRIADTTALFENNARFAPNLLARIEHGIVTLDRLSPANPFHRRLASAIVAARR